MSFGDTTALKGKLFNGDAERAILGAILLDPHNAIYNQASELIKPNDFVLDSHRRIFVRIAEMAEQSIPVDLVTLTNELINHSELEAVGGASYISSLTDGLPRLGNIEHYARIVKDKALLRRLVDTASNITQRCVDGSESAQEILDSAESEVLALGEDRLRSGFTHIKDIFAKSFGSLDALHDRGKSVTGISTGFKQIDEMTRGLQPSELIIIAARPSMGKTSFALDLARWAAVHDKETVGIFSLEMSAPSLVLRLLCSEADVDSHKLQTGFASRDDWNKLAMALGRLLESPLYIDDSPALSILEMRAKSRRLYKEHGARLLLLDYLQLMGGAQTEYENRTQEVSAISRGLKSLAKELDIPVIALSQLSRASEAGKRKPLLSDLRESGQIEQDADVVAFIHREEMINRTEENKGIAEIIIAKQRNGPTGTVNLVFIPQFTSFRNPPEAFGDGGGFEGSNPGTVQ